MYISCDGGRSIINTDNVSELYVGSRGNGYFVGVTEASGSSTDFGWYLGAEDAFDALRRVFVALECGENTLDLTLFERSEKVT